MKTVAVVIATCAFSIVLMWAGARALRVGSACLIDSQDQAITHGVFVARLFSRQCEGGGMTPVVESWIERECVHGMWRDHPGGGYYLKVRIASDAITPRKLSTSIPGLMLEGDVTGVYQAYMEEVVPQDTLFVFLKNAAASHEACDTIRLIRSP